jgi:hypothetical protein
MLLLDLVLGVVVVVLLVGLFCWLTDLVADARARDADEARRFAGYYVSNFGKVRERRDG